MRQNNKHILSIQNAIGNNKGGTGVKEKIIIKDKEKTDFKFEKPKQYRVIMHNNNYTAFEAVTDVLKVIFHLDNQRAQALMNHCHIHGFAQILVSTKDICDEKVEQAHNYCDSKAGTPGFGGTGRGEADYEFLRFSVEEMPHT